jgi:hypothetical protein
LRRRLFGGPSVPRLGKETPRNIELIDKPLSGELKSERRRGGDRFERIGRALGFHPKILAETWAKPA